MKISKLAIINQIICLQLISYQILHAQPTKSNQVVSANNKFTFDLYHQLKGSPQNMFYSPFSISVALGMTVEGAGNATRKEMLSTMHLSDNDIIRKKDFMSLLTSINSPNKEYKLSTANSIWVQSGMPLESTFTSSLKNNFFSKVNLQDFKTIGENCRIPINSWVADQTNQKIKDLIPSGSISKFTRMVLTNAIHFKGQWQLEFSKQLTADENFQLIDNKSVVAPMMKSFDRSYKYLKTDQAAILEIPYKSDELSMVIILPDAGKFETLESSLTSASYDMWQKQLIVQPVNVIIPKFKFEIKSMLSETLQQMGMPLAFSDNADFSGMTKSESLKISQVIHQAFIDVNEEGTEAAAATAVIMVRTESKIDPDIPLEFRADRPFIFLIKHQKTGCILFIGRMMNPLTK